MDVLGYFLALVIGISLGLIGGGGSILTVPVLVYVLGVNPILATAYSLFVVGCSSVVGAVNNFRKGLISMRTAVVFAIPSILAVYITRLCIVPAIPERLFEIGAFSIGKDMGIMLFFACIMILAAYSMLRSRQNCIEEMEQGPPQFNYPLIAIEGFAVGVITGIVGAGGGFLIIPALVLWIRLPMKLAIGTSLLIIASKSLIGFIGDIQAGQNMDWCFLLLFTGFSIIGIFIGGYIGNFVSGRHLKKCFGWVVLLMAFYVIFKELHLYEYL